jgi:hypothetical protein
LTVSQDPFGIHNEESVIWIRKCYKDLRDILRKSGPSDRAIVLDTTGIGKSIFTIFWICYLAARKEKVIYRSPNSRFYLLDFSKEVAIARGPTTDMLHPDLQSVLNDPSSGLILDGHQKHRLDDACRKLLAYSTNMNNYKEFGKDRKAREWYLPVCTGDEMEKFCDEFEEHRSKFSAMGVPDKQTVLANLKELGGVP